MKMKIKKDGINGRSDGWWFVTYQCPACGKEVYSELKQVWGAKKAAAPLCECINKSKI